MPPSFVYIGITLIWMWRGCVCVSDRMVVGFTTTCVTSPHHHLSCEFESRWWRGVLDTTLSDKVCQWLAVGRWFSPGTPIASDNKTDLYDITEIVLKVALNTTAQPNSLIYRDCCGLNTEKLRFKLTNQEHTIVNCQIKHEWKIFENTRWTSIRQ